MNGPTARTAPNHRLLLPTIAAGTMLAPLNSTMIAVALPDIQRDFGTSVTSTSWLVTIYLIAMAVGQPIGGRLGDLHGRRPVYLIGLAWFALASIGCALAPGLAWLIVFRVQQALAGTLVFPNSAAIVREAIPEGRRGMAFGIVGLCASAAAALGPPIGGVLVYALGWASIFWVNLPLIALVAAMAWQSLPARTGTRRREGFDLAGIGLLTAALSAVMLTPSLLKDGRGAVAALILVAGSVAAWAFVRHERGAVAPVVDPRLFRSRHFAAACAVVALANLVMYTTLLAVPLYLEHVEGQGARVTGLTLGAMSVLAAFSTPLGGRWADRGGRWLPAVTGSAVIVAGAALMSAGMAVGSIPVLVAGLMALGLGLGISGAPVQAASVDSVPAARAGSASGVYSTSRYVGSVVGSSALALVFANEPNAGDGDLFAWVFSALVIVAVGALVASARVADRQASHPRSHPART